MINTNHYDAKYTVLDFVDDSIVPNPNPPGIIRILQLETVRRAGILGQGQDGCVYSLENITRKRPYLPGCLGRNLNPVAHLQAEGLSQVFIGNG